MIARGRTIAWLLAGGLVSGCASAAPRPEASAGEPARPRVEVTTDTTVSSAPSTLGAEPGSAAPDVAPRPTPESATPAPVREPSLAAIAPPTTAGPPAASPERTAPRQLVLNFDNADVEIVLQAAAEIVGFNYVLAPVARGRKITVQTVGKVTSDDVFAVLLTILDVNGLAAVRSGPLYRIVPREGAPQAPIRTLVGRGIAGPPTDEIVTQIVPLRFVNAQDAVALLRPFVATQGAVTAHRETNLLILTETVANVQRLLAMLALVDVEVALNELQIVPLRHADAQELAQLLGLIFAGGRLRAGPSPPVAPGASAASLSSGPPGSGAASGDHPLIVPERRSNSLVVHARKQDMETIRRLVERLDVDLYGGQRVFIHFAENTRARDLAATLDAIYGRGDRGPAITGSQPTRLGSTSISSSAANPLASSAALAASAAGALGAATIARPPTAATGFPGLSGEGAPPGTEIRFVADEITNAIIVTTYPRLWKEIEETIRRLDRMPRQVLIEVMAAEVTLTDDTKLGLEWAVRSGRFDISSAPSGALPGRPPSSLIPAGGPVPIGFNAFTFAADRFLAALNALATENRVNVLSNPSIMTAENRKAVINVSTSVPIVTSQQVPVATGGITGNAITQTVEYRDAGIILTVTPRIGEQGTVALDVKQEVNEVGENEPPPINSPRFTKREAETSVVLMNNQTLVLGGLIQSKRARIRVGVPWLHRIPILGYIFGSVEDRIEKTELLLLITPRAIGTALDAARLTDEMRRATPELERSLRGAPGQPAPRQGSPPEP